MDSNIHFLAMICHEKSREGVSEIECTIEHKLKSYNSGEYIALQGDRIEYLYILSVGKVKTEIVSDSGLTVSVEEIQAPYPLAAAFLFADNNRFPVDVIAMKDCEVILVSKECVEKQITVSHDFLRGFMAFIANRVQFLSERLKIFSQKNIKSKIAYYILQREKNGMFDLGRSIASLSEYFGVERPSLSRALSEMNAAGIIEFAAGKGKILNPNAIKELLM